MQTATPYDAKHLLQNLQIAVASRTHQDVFHLADMLARAAALTAHNAFLDIAACVAAEYARGNYERAGSLIADGLYLVTTAMSSIAA
jgi:hypothetical protein